MIGTDEASATELQDDGSKVNGFGPNEISRRNLRWVHNKVKDDKAKQKDKTVLAELEEVKEDFELLKDELKQDVEVLEEEDQKKISELKEEQEELKEGEVIPYDAAYASTVGYDYETEEEDYMFDTEDKTDEDYMFDIGAITVPDYDEESFGERKLSGMDCSADKKVTLYKFCIEGDCDHGAYGEHKLRLDGHFLTSYYKNYREGQCHNTGAGARTVRAYKSLTVGTEEEDDSSQNDSFFATMPASKWYSRTCGTYEIHLAKNHKHERQYTSCLDVTLSGSYKEAIEGEIKSSNCVSWTQPSESFGWYLKVEPVAVTRKVGWYMFKNMDNPNLCMDVWRNKVHLWDCHAKPNQWWYLDSAGRLRSGADFSKCLESGSHGNLYAKFFTYRCHSGAHQKWDWKENGLLQNRGTKKFAGVSNGCGGAAKQAKVENHWYSTCGKSSTQKRWISIGPY